MLTKKGKLGMQNFISTDTIMLISLLCKKMPNLFNSIVQCSSATNKPNKNSTALSARQIKEARLHSNTIVLQALTTAALIQNALDTTNHKIEELLKQRTTIEKTLIDLLANEPKERSAAPETASSIEKLKQQLVDLNNMRKELESIKDDLQQELDNMDQILPKQKEIWTQHLNQYSDQLIKELGEQNITLSEEEQAQLRNSSLTASNIKEQTTNLENLNIKIPKKASGFTIHTMTIVVAALSRTLQKTDQVSGLVKKLSAISDEKSHAKKIQDLYKKQHEEIGKKIQELKAKANDITGLSPTQLALVDKIKATAAKPKQKPEPKGEDLAHAAS